MPKWILICQNCNAEFEHSQISDVGMFSFVWPPKPEISPTNQCVCPNCGHMGTYKRTDLLYRAR
jgi:hypothetical protein